MPATLRPTPDTTGEPRRRDLDSRCGRRPADPAAARRRPRRTGDGWSIARPFGVPVDVTPTWFLVAGADHRRVRGHRRARGPRSGPVAVRRVADLRGAALRLGPGARAQPHGRRAARRACRCAGSACTCSAASRRSSGRPRPRAGRPASRSPGRWSRCCSPAVAFGVGELLEPGHGRPPAGLGADAEQPARRASSTCCPGLPLDGGRVRVGGGLAGHRPPAHRHRRRRLGRPGRRRRVLLGVPFLVAPLRGRDAVAGRRRLGGAARRVHLGRRQPGDPARAACSSGCPAAVGAVADPARDPGARSTCRWPRPCAAPRLAGARGLVVVDGGGHAGRAGGRGARCARCRWSAGRGCRSAT